LPQAPGSRDVRSGTAREPIRPLIGNEPSLRLAGFGGQPSLQIGLPSRSGGAAKAGGR